MKSGSRYGIFNIYILIRKIDKFNRHLRKVNFTGNKGKNLIYAMFVGLKMQVLRKLNLQTFFLTVLNKAL